ncbi:Tab2/Atab2 family RNA-binding protein [Phormidium tenue FACHB-886]|nr:Tab2/Atab2 family RNA-binding protein [Phormidium tenue FACHB-886]
MTTIWELDFYSRPVLDENQKKLWEVLICESPLQVRAQPEALFRYSKYFANTEVNSVSLKTAVQEAIATAPNPPARVRFFRRQMSNMITKACEEAGVPAYPSRRTLALHQWIEQRMEDYYPTLPNYQAGSNPSVALPTAAPQPLPAALIGEKWRFVSLEASAFEEMPEWDIGFSEAFPPTLFGASPTTSIPGVIIYSSRALPLAGWMSGLELACLKFRRDLAQLVLETGANDAWILASLPNPALQAEAEGFEKTKQQANQIHFVAVQSDPASESFAGFWLMQELNLA